jgi:hypothetical protein
VNAETPAVIPENAQRLSGICRQGESGNPHRHSGKREAFIRNLQADSEAQYLW